LNRTQMLESIEAPLEDGPPDTDLLEHV
jgi:hypothetical protein